MKNRFYEIEPTWGNKWYWGRVITKILAKIDANGMRGFKGTMQVEIDMGTTPGDFLWNTKSLIIVSEKVLDIWRPFKKFETYNVEVLNKKIPFKYTGVSIHGNGGPLDETRTIVQYDDVGGRSGKYICGMKGFYFFEDKWDKSDLFTLSRHRSSYLVTERVVKAMKKTKVTNCKYVPIDEYEWGYIEPEKLIGATCG